MHVRGNLVGGIPRLSRLQPRRIDHSEQSNLGKHNNSKNEQRRLILKRRIMICYVIHLIVNNYGSTGNKYDPRGCSGS